MAEPRKFNALHPTYGLELCPACGSADLVVSDADGEAWALIRCGACGEATEVAA